MIRFVAAVGFHFWETAAQEMLISQWAKEGKRRAAALVEMMRTGHDDQIGQIGAAGTAIAWWWVAPRRGTGIGAVGYMKWSPRREPKRRVHFMPRWSTYG